MVRFGLQALAGHNMEVIYVGIGHHHIEPANLKVNTKEIIIYRVLLFITLLIGTDRIYDFNI